MICVSVIIPIFNAQDYLVECLESIINQTLKEIEIILINDGSTDNSLEIINKYATIDSRIVVINHSNIGAGLSRNKGIDVATGKYLSFLDADDFFEPNMLEKAYKKSELTDSDICVFRSSSYDNNTITPMNYTILEFLLPSQEIFSLDDIEKDIFKAFVGWAWDKLFLADFVKSHNLLFQGLRTSNDLLFVYTALVSAEKITVLNENFVYHREKNSTSLSNTREVSYDNFYFALIELKSFLVNNNLYNRFKIDYINYTLNLSLWQLNTLDNSTAILVYDKLKNNWFYEFEIDTLTKSEFYRIKEFKQYNKITALPYEKWSGKSKSNIIINKIKNLNISPKLRKNLYNLRDNGIKGLLELEK